MGRDFCDAFPVAKALFESAESAIDFPLREVLWDRGDEVHRTDVAQPGILVTSAAIVTVLRERGLDTGTAPLCAGLSLGEYTALWCVGALTFQDAVRLVRLRGQAMQAASEQIESSMTSLLGADLETAEKLAALGAEVGICSVANLNAPGQIVISGELAALDAVEAVSKEHGVKRAVRLDVAGGFHSECMRPAAEKLQAALSEIEIRPPAVPFCSNVTGAPVDDPENIRQALAQQVCAPVLWEKTLRWALSQGIEHYLEPGPGKVLAGLMRKTARATGRTAEVRGVETPEDLD
jgi:[acyl-carrier-protein] S-malonyltransferase